MSILALTLALAQAAPLAPTVSANETPVRSYRQQIFVSPAGEPFRVAVGRPYPVADWFAQADTNHDGRLTEAEFIADFLRFTATLDTNHDGVIDGPELEAYETQIAPEVHSGSSFSGYETSGGGDGDDGTKQSGPPADSLPMGAGKYGLINLPEPVAAMDVDIRGRITRRNVTEAASYRFDLLDTRQRGYLTLADLPETYAQGHQGSVGGKRHGEGRHSHWHHD